MQILLLLSFLYICESFQRPPPHPSLPFRRSTIAVLRQKEPLRSSNYFKRRPLRTHHIVQLWLSKKDKNGISDNKNSTEIESLHTNVINDNTKSDSRPSGFVPDLDFLVVDLFAILVGCELLGLIRDLVDPRWLQSGGWFQSVKVTQIPFTLSNLIQEFSTNCVLWVVATFAIEVFDDDTSSSASTITASFKLTAAFGILRGLLALVVAASNQATEVNMEDIFLQIYVLALTTSTARYFYSNLFGCK